MAVSKDQIQQIRTLIKTGKRKQAVQLLAKMIERDHENPELWWLLANATDDNEQARAALDQLLMIQPGNEAAKKMLARLETRHLLRQMGVHETTAKKRSPVLIIGVVVGVVALGVLLIVLLGALSNRDPEPVAALPTSVILPTLTSTATHTATVTASPTITSIPPTLTPLPTFTADVSMPVTQPEITAEVFAVQPEITAEAVPPTNAIAMMPTLPMVFPTLPPADFQGNTDNSDSGAADNPDTRSGFLQPTTANIFPTATFAGFGTGSLFGATPTISSFGAPATPTAIPAEERGQVTERQPAQDIIRPYALHSWQFSGFRAEKITLDLLNVTGSGNPSLVLRGPTGEIIMQDIDTQNTSNRDARIEITLPEDGIYTVIVSIAAVDEQLYYLTIKRG